MNVGSNTITTALKAALLATSLLGFSVIGIIKVSILDILPFLPFILIITFILSLIGIFFIIQPFYYHNKEVDLTTIFKNYFPVYALIIFILCVLCIVLSAHLTASILFSITYITAMFAWIWFFKNI